MEYDDDEVGLGVEAPTAAWRGRVNTSDPYFALEEQEGGCEDYDQYMLGQDVDWSQAQAFANAQETEIKQEPQLPVVLPENAQRLIRQHDDILSELRQMLASSAGEIPAHSVLSRQEELKEKVLGFEASFRESYGVRPSRADLPPDVKAMYSERKQLKEKGADCHATQTDPSGTEHLINEAEQVLSAVQVEFMAVCTELQQWRDGNLRAITTIDAETGAPKTEVIEDRSKKRPRATGVMHSAALDSDGARGTCGLQRLVKVKQETAELQEGLQDADGANNEYVVFIERQKDLIGQLKAQITELGHQPIVS